MKRILLFLALSVALSIDPGTVESFCGFYVAKADTKIFNRASQVVLARHDDKTVITMVNDFSGEPKEFAVVIPVPTLIEREQIHVGDKKVIDHLDAYTAPRLVEYFDGNPCQLRTFQEFSMSDEAPAAKSSVRRADALGVTVEVQYTVGEYDIVILSAKQGAGLETWLKENGYRIPQGATEVLQSYIKQKMHFFLAKVNLQEQSKLGYSYLRPLQVAYESPRFMLPLRLGTVNADGPQELIIYTLTRKGRVEPTNYRSVKLPTGMDLPVYVKERFKEFYRSMFDRQVHREDMRAVFLEYAWDMNWCDPCAADPLSYEELKSLGVFWLNESASPRIPKDRLPSGTREVFVTRLHVRYDKEHFPEDIIFQETADRNNFQARYVLRHPWKGADYCPISEEYQRASERRREHEAQRLAHLTGWDITAIRARMNISNPTVGGGESWWQRLWSK